MPKSQRRVGLMATKFMLFKLIKKVVVNIFYIKGGELPIHRFYYPPPPTHLGEHYFQVGVFKKVRNVLQKIITQHNFVCSLWFRIFFKCFLHSFHMIV